MNRNLSLTLSALLASHFALGCGDDTPERDITSVTDSGAVEADASDAGADALDATDAVEGDAPEDPVAEIYAVIFEPSCGGTRCHLAGRSLGRLNLDLDEGLMERLLAPSSVEGIAIVEPGRPEDSYLFLKLTDEYRLVGGRGSLMPLGTSGLAPDEIDYVRDWIAALPVE